MNTQELKEKRGLLDTELKNLNAKVTAKTPLTEAEELRFDEVIAEIESLNSEIEKAEKREAAIAASEKRNVTPGGFAIVKPTDNEEQVKKEFRFVDAINAISKNNLQNNGFLKEINEEGRRSMSNSGVNMDDENGFVVPAFIIGGEKRDMAAVTNDTSKAGYTIQTDLMAQSWIDTLVNKILFPGMGATFMPGLVGNVAIPKKTALSGATWLTETQAITPADSTWGQVTMAPKRVGDATAFSLKLLAQSSLGIENIVRMDLLDSISQALQNAIIHGPSTGNSPLGIINTSGVNSVTIDTNGGPLTWAKIVALETAVANANADIRNLSYLTNSKVRGAAKGLFQNAGATGLPLWQAGALPLNGYGCGVTNAVPSTNVKGSSGAVCSSLLFGDWSNLLIGQWGGLVLTANPYALDLSGQVRITVNAFFDTAVRHAEAFSVANDITT